MGKAEKKKKFVLMNPRDVTRLDGVFNVSSGHIWVNTDYPDNNNLLYWCGGDNIKINEVTSNRDRLFVCRECLRLFRLWAAEQELLR